jgi:hypothetical protein
MNFIIYMINILYNLLKKIADYKRVNLLKKITGYKRVNLLKKITGYKRVNMLEQISGLIFSNPRSFSVDSKRLKETL